MQDTLKEYRKKIMLDIIMDPNNSAINQALKALDKRPQLVVRHNHPRNKHKEVRTSFIAPSTKSMIWCANGIPQKKKTLQMRET
ncbi:hypothetical protein AHAS_Ahas13G0228900 [Arachis hypogaea]